MPEGESIVDLMLRLENLDNIKRFNQFPIINPRTVSSHSFYTCWWAMLIALHENGRKETQQQGFQVLIDMT